MKATLYVKGVKTKQVEIYDSVSWRAMYVKGLPVGQPSPTYQAHSEATHKSVLPEDQKMLVERVKALAVKYHFELKVIDVGENRFLDKMKVRFEGISGFPTLLADNGLRIVGDITEERIKSLFVHNRSGTAR